jgi:hypothetical protein
VLSILFIELESSFWGVLKKAQKKKRTNSSSEKETIEESTLQQRSQRVTQQRKARVADEQDSPNGQVQQEKRIRAHKVTQNNGDIAKVNKNLLFADQLRCYNQLQFGTHQPPLNAGARNCLI